MSEEKVTEIKKPRTKKAPVKKEPVQTEPAIKNTMAAAAPKIAAIRQDQFRDDDMIPCMSLVSGRLIRAGKRTNSVYIWEKLGDIENMAYVDLKAEMSSNRSQTIYNPDIFICTPEVYENNPKLIQIYENLYNPTEIENLLLDGEIEEIKVMVETSSDAAKTNIKNVASDLIRNQYLTDYRVIRYLDQILETNFQELIR